MKTRSIDAMTSTDYNTGFNSSCVTFQTPESPDHLYSSTGGGMSLWPLSNETTFANNGGDSLWYRYYLYKREGGNLKKVSQYNSIFKSFSINDVKKYMSDKGWTLAETKFYPREKVNVWSTNARKEVSLKYTKGIYVMYCHLFATKKSYEPRLGEWHFGNSSVKSWMGEYSNLKADKWEDFRRLLDTESSPAPTTTGPTSPTTVAPGPTGPTPPAPTVPTEPTTVAPGPTGPTPPAPTGPTEPTTPGPTGPPAPTGPTTPGSAEPTTPAPTGPTTPASTGPTTPTITKNPTPKPTENMANESNDDSSKIWMLVLMLVVLLLPSCACAFYLM